VKYNPVTEEIINELISILGRKNVLTDPEKIEAYSHDETPAEQYAHLPEVVVTPTSAVEIAEVMKLANRELIPVTPPGGGKWIIRRSNSRTWWDCTLCGEDEQGPGN